MALAYLAAEPHALPSSDKSVMPTLRLVPRTGTYGIIVHMSKLLEQVLADVRELPEDEQDMAANALLQYLAFTRDPQLSDEQLDEVRRRRAEQKPERLTLAEFDRRLGRLGA